MGSETTAKVYQAAGDRALKMGAQHRIKENEKKKDSTKQTTQDIDLLEKKTFGLGHAEFGTLAGCGGVVFRQRLDIQMQGTQVLANNIYIWLKKKRIHFGTIHKGGAVTAMELNETSQVARV